MYNFDEIIPREKTGSIKYDWRSKIFGKEDVIPMWVADMDFRTPPFIINALEERLSHQIMGYSFRPDAYFDSFASWLMKRHSWEVKREWMEFSPGVVPALNMCTLAYTDPGDEIIIQPPVYTPFHAAVVDHGRKLVYNRLKETSVGWEMDLDGLAELITPDTRMIIISNPHNPVGRVWRQEELNELVSICYEKNIVILSDEIHSDLTLKGNRHIPVASLSDRAAAITVTCMAPSKTFNIAGLSTSTVIIADRLLREKYKSVLEGMHLHLGNVFGNVASEAAYSSGHRWLDELLDYVSGNMDYASGYCAANLPLIKPVMPEATYLMWLDCRQMNMSGHELQHFFVHRAGVGLNEGSAFGPGGEGFMRINMGCPRSTVERAFDNIHRAFNTFSADE